MRKILKALFGFSLVCFIGATVGLTTTKAVAEDYKFDNVIHTKVTDVNNENLDNGNCFVMVLSQTDFMTATEWSNLNYKWLNAEEITSFEARATIDLANNNVCNAELDQHTSEFNFEEKIFIDGVSLATFAQTHPYKLIANKRTRVHTLSLDFAPGVVSSMTTVEIKEGCTFPTLKYGYIGVEESSSLFVDESMTFKKMNGKWTDFVSYEEGKEYYGNEKNFQLNFSTMYKGHTSVAIDSYTEFFMKNAVQGELLDGKAVVTRANTEKGNLMVLNFVNPIDASQFSKLNLRVYINHQVDVVTYNANSITSASLGTALESFTVGGGMFTYLNMNSALYADADNYVRTIVFQFVDDCKIQYDGNGNEIYDSHGNLVRDTFFFVSFNLEDAKNAQLVYSDSFMLLDKEDAYEITFRFNKIGAINNECTLDTSKVLLNGCPLSDVLSECQEATAQWYSANGIYQINVYLPKSYTGVAQIRNAQYGYANNSMCVVEGLEFPNGDILDKSHTCHLYAGEKIADYNMVDTYAATKIEAVDYSFVSDSKNLHFTLYFDKNVTSSPYYHACETESWRGIELPKNNVDYDIGVTEIFLNGGYKTSLLDNIIINGLTIGEWHAHDSRMFTNVQVHYGNTALNCVDIFFEKLSPNTYNQLYDLVMSGNGITIEVKEGLKFMVNTEMKETQTFALINGSFVEDKEETGLRVYFNGKAVNDKDTVTVKTAVSDKCIVVEGINSYQVSSEKNGDKTAYTVSYGDGQLFTFTVIEDIVQVVASEPQDSGCGAQIGINAAWSVSLAMAAVVIIIWRGKKHEEDCNQ